MELVRKRAAAERYGMVFVKSKLQRSVERADDAARVFLLSPFYSCSNLHRPLESIASRVGQVAPLPVKP